METVSFEDFKKIELKTAKVVEVEEIPGADKLWKLVIDTGAGKKTIVAGIKTAYSQESLLGKNIIVVNNLAPAAIRGVESHGMLLAAKDGGVLSLVTPDKELPPGSVVS
ncbi:MAG: methionine--tRNA ligase subunit beta [Candidatus Omnitrophica bacterium]|nr:methionine--tRNA ligase subunit beta [Candidatus Omnitrophota bacterium]